MLSGGGYTYFHESLDQKKWNDHFLISRSIASATKQHLILESGANVSDHLPLMMELSVSLSVAPERHAENAKTPSLKWEKCSNEHKQAYTNQLSQCLLDAPPGLTQCRKSHCSDQTCLTSIQQEHDALIGLMKKADKVLPRHKPGVQKSWWTDELTDLKNQNIEIHRLWQLEGKPHHGRVNDERLRVKAAYRRALKTSRRAPQQTCWNRMHDAFTTKDTNQFWKEWKKQYGSNKSHLHPVVDGISSKPDIAENFKTHFTAISKPNNAERVAQIDAEFCHKYAEAKSAHEQSCHCDEHRVSLDTVIDATFSMKKGKSKDDEGVSAEHFFHAPLTLFDRVQSLFNAMLQHGFVPAQFKRGTIVPIVKDNQGDHGDMHNYRGVTLASILSKIFEHVLKIIFAADLSSSKYQFGFKKRSSTSHAIYCLKETINYFTENGSNVYCSFLDASKAFDRVVHSGLYLKMLQRGVPFVFLEVMMFWYSGLQCRVRWGECHSTWFTIAAGVRQGGVLSPDLYCMYIDELVVILSRLGVGCYMRDVFLSALLYADDMAILSPSLKGLQILLKACKSFCRDWYICLNHKKKQKNMAFGRRRSALCSLTLDGNPIEWVDAWKYLGVTLKSHTGFNCCIKDRVASFYKCLNAILRIDGHSNELVMLRLLEAHCIPILTYCIEILYVANSDIRRKLRVAYNSVFRKIFNYRWRDSVRELQGFLQRPTWEELAEIR